MQPAVIDDRYTLKEPLGDGGMARVYLAHDEVLDRDVALKVLRDAYADDEEFVERFRREARSAAGLAHPNIVSVFDQGRSGDGAYYIAMEYVPRGTLMDRIKRDGALAPRAAAGVARQIADALSAAHSRGVIHRDIKPQNVLVTAAGDVKVTDFGIARAAASPMTATSAVLGTASYMSPEQTLGRRVGPESDLYSLGVVLYQMLTGDLPYTSDDAHPVALAMMHVNEPVPSPREANPYLPEELDAITTRLLAKKPEDRYASAEELADDLERFLFGLPLSVAPTARVEKETEKMAVPPPPVPRERTERTSARPPAAAPARASGPPGRKRQGGLLTALGALLLGLLLLGGLALGLGRNASESPTRPQASEATSGADVPGVGDFSGEVPPSAQSVPANAEAPPAPPGADASADGAVGGASGDGASGDAIQSPSQAVQGTSPAPVQQPPEVEAPPPPPATEVTDQPDSGKGKQGKQDRPEAVVDGGGGAEDGQGDTKPEGRTPVAPGEAPVTRADRSPTEPA